MLPLQENSSAAAFWLMMLTLDVDGVRKDVEFDTVAECLKELSGVLVDPTDTSPEALTPILNVYYDDTAGMESEEELNRYMDEALSKITDQKLRESLFRLLVKIAMSDNELHLKENAFLRRACRIWQLPFEAP